jgi:uncharacterized Tic20 family protein
MLLSTRLSCGPTVCGMTEPPRPPGEGNPSDPTAPFNQSTPPPPPPYGAPQPPVSGSGGYAPPPSSGAGGYAPPPSSGAGGYGPPPSSGAGGYGPPPTSGAGYGPPPGAYQPPPGGQYGAPPPYGAPGYGPPQSAADDKTWILVSHFGGAAAAFISGGVLGWVPPLVAMMSKGNTSPAVKAEAVKALNFQILWSIITVVCWIAACAVIGFFLAPIAILIEIIFGVIAGVKASNNEQYNYPLSYSFIK